jgi:hypothetical protein
VEYSGQLTVDEATRGLLLHLRRRRIWRRTFLPWFFVVLAAPFLLQPHASLLRQLLPAAIFAMVGFVLSRVYWPRQVRRSARYEDALLFVVAESSTGVRVIPKRVLGGADQVAEVRAMLERHLGRPR